MRIGFPPCPRRDGFVLVAVLFSVMVLVSAATGLAWFVRSQVRQVEQERETLVGRSVAFVVIRQLAAGLARDTNDYDSLKEVWFGPHMVPLEELGVALVVFVPADDKISLASLFLPDGETLRREMERPWRRIWERLDRTDLEQVLLDFMDSDRSPRLGGTEREGFANQIPSDLSELLACPDVTAEVLYGSSDGTRPGLSDFVSPWGGRKINVNVVGPEVLAILDESLTLDTAEEIVEMAKEEPFKSLNDFNSRAAISEAALPRLASLVGFKSETFRADIQVQLLSGAQKQYEVVLQKRGKRVEIILWKEG